MKIRHIQTIEILDSRGNPTLKTTIELENGIKAAASVPSGASRGKHEAFELRDNDNSRYNGMGVLNAVKNVNTLIAPHLQSINIENLQMIDEKMIELDHTENKKNLGANTILSVSLAAARALAKAQNKPLWQTLNIYYFKTQKPAFPRLMINVINGGKHADWHFDIQEFLIIPKTNKPLLAVRIGAEIFHALGNIFYKECLSTLTGDEGGYAPNLPSNSNAFEHIINAIMRAGHKKTIDVDLGIDSAAAAFYKDGLYHLRKEEKTVNADDLMNYYADLHNEYSIFSFEDPFAEDEWACFGTFTRKMSQEGGLVIGDDLYTTNTTRIKKGIEQKTTNAIVIKPNQIGTLKETAEAISLAQENGLKVIISHRSGETEDTFISDLAVASSADFLKAGSMSRSERLAKYNRLIEIEQMEFT